MGTTLTGTTPQDTYDSLIKVTDNGPLSGTAKYLSDGLGNDSVLALSTSRVTIGGTNPYVGLLTIYGSASLSGGFGIRNSAGTAAGFLATYAAGSGGGSTDISIGSAGFLEINTAGAERMRITSTGNVGIGTSAPASKLHVLTADTYGAQINTSITAAATTRLSIGSFGTGAGGSGGSVAIGAAHNHSGSAQSAMTFYTHDGSNLNEVGRFLATGGLTFNGDTAAANALDDYEEGTFTMTATPATSGTITLNPSNNTARYTKIGRQVTIQAFVTISAVSSPVGTSVILGGLPFTIANTNAAAGSGSVAWADASASYVRSVLPSIFFANTTLLYASIDASTLASPDELFINMTYTV